MTDESTALSIKNLHKVYGTGLIALQGIDLEVKRGDFFALLGPNGAGKSTTIGIISSLVRKSSGTVRVFGIDIDVDFAAAKALIGLVPQEINFSQFESVLEIVLNQAGYYGLGRHEALQRAQIYLEQLGLWERRNEISRNLSGGMKRRLMIARALVHNPKLLILDEPTAGVDIEIRRSMWTFLRELNEAGTTIILTTHYLEEAEQLCRNIAIIDDGQIIENTSMRALLARLHSESFIFDCETPYTVLPQIDIAELIPLDDHRFEAIIDKDQNLNDVFARLTHAGMPISSMRNKNNRLEEFFVNLVQANE